MAARKPVTEVVQFEQPHETLQTFIEETPEDEALKAVISQLGGDTQGGKVNVYRQRKNLPLAFVKSYTPSEFTEEALQAEYGPGDYQVRVYDSGGLRARKSIAIDAPLNAPVPGQSPPPYMVDKLVENMNSGFEKMGAMFAQALGQLAANQPKPQSRAEMIQELAMMREMFGGNQQQPTDPLGVLNLAKELSTLINPPPNDENTMMMEGLKMFAPLLQNQFNGPAPNFQANLMPNPSGNPPLQANPQLIAPAPITAGPVANVQAQQESPEMFITLYLKGLVANAKADKDPLPYAHVILDMAGEQVVRQMIASPTWFDEIVKRVPEAAQHQPWFEELKANMVEILAELTAERNSGNSGDNPLPDSNNASGPATA